MNRRGVATLAVTRKSEWNSRFRRFNILVDGTKIGDIRNGRTEEFEIPPGQYEVVATIDWCSSNSLTIQVEPDARVHLTCGHRFPAWRTRAAWIAPETFLWLAPADAN